MKKIYLLIVFNLIFKIDNIEAQVFEFGPKVGLNVSSLTNGNNLPKESTTLIEDNTHVPTVDLHIGLVLKINISKVFAVQSEFLYSSEGFDYNGGAFSGENIRAKLDYFNIPILTDFKIFKRNDRISLQFGPQFGFLITDKLKIKNSELDSFSPASKTNNALVFGSQFKIKNMGITFQVRYSRGLNNIWEDSNIKSSVFSGSIGYLF